MELQKAFTNLTEKFTSGNSIPVERNTITRAEWEPICAVIAEALKPSHNQLKQAIAFVLKVASVRFNEIELEAIKGDLDELEQRACV